MTSLTIVEHLAALPSLASIPRAELEWLASHGSYRRAEAGTIISRKGEPVEILVVILRGHMAIHVDRGAGPRRVAEWKRGDISGLLPYSRMSGPPGDTFFEEATEYFSIPKQHFPEMISACPAFTALTVHIMLDRARSFNTSDLQDEKMISLGKLAAGLAHELNNPASASVRDSKLLIENLASADEASRALAVVGLTDELFRTIDELRSSCLTNLTDPTPSPIEQADRQENIAAWLHRHHVDDALAAPLADTAVTLEALDSLASMIVGDALIATLQWIAASCASHRLANEIAQTATRIDNLVAAVKRFTYMDHLAGPESVELEGGLRDTITMLTPKSRSKRASITLALEPDLPRVHMTGGELNQVWFNIVDNALDAIGDSGRIEISARRELDRVVVRVVDDGAGIRQEDLPRIFDPFFTTKPPGQGTGLGLSIAQKLLRRHEGDIVIQSDGDRTECRISLPTEREVSEKTSRPAQE